ncbi:MAG TPA: FAD-dependent oxidoreductase [Chloroflexota bacterium]|nr:FAD-dependent oxidoreductase [Chloroflexota bacterium]
MAELGNYDIVVVGAGLAGLTAGLFAARQGRATLVLEAQVPGGHLVNIHQIEDYPGFPEGVAGYELCPLVQEQAANQGAEFQLAAVERVEPADGGWRVLTADGACQARAVIVASGSRPRALGVPGEERLFGRGVSHCASCDGAFVRGGTVGVVGGGDSALQEALALSEYAARVLVLHRGASLAAQQTYQERVLAHPATEVRCGVVVEEVLGEQAVSGVRLRDAPGAESTLELAGLFVYVGLAPNTDCLRDLGVLAPGGRVPTDAWMRTPLPGLLAAGDVRADSAAQAITAAGDGATAALAAHRYLADGAWRPHP